MLVGINEIQELQAMKKSNSRIHNIRIYINKNILTGIPRNGSADSPGAKTRVWQETGQDHVFWKQAERVRILLRYSYFNFYLGTNFLKTVTKIIKFSKNIIKTKIKMFKKL
jgi:hypothetical protein